MPADGAEMKYELVLLRSLTSTTDAGYGSLDQLTRYHLSDRQNSDLKIDETISLNCCIIQGLTFWTLAPKMLLPE